jgi:raffinose/stachyose/melibiose transport system permease protein
MKTSVWRPYLYIAPLFLVEGAIVILPTLLNVGYSFTEWDGLSRPVFVGIANYVHLVADPVFRLSLLHNVEWTVVFLTVPIAMALLAAFSASRIRRGQMLFRTLFALPYVVAPAVTCQIWKYIINPNHGIGAQLSHAFGWSWAEVSLLGARETVLWTVAGINNWHWWGFIMILLLSAMQSIPPDLYDAAKVDGASTWQEFINVVLPGIRPTLVYVLIMTASASFLTFNYVWILTQGGPGHGSELLSTFMFKTGFMRYDVGYSSAIAVGMALLAASFAVVFAVLRRRGWDV